MAQWKEYLTKEAADFLKGYGGEALDDLIIYRSPNWFFFGSGLMGIIGCFLGISWSLPVGVLGLFIGFFLPATVLYISNHRDNRIILKDLKGMYETISVQLEAGLHIQQALLETEGMMKNKRLRNSLNILTEALIGGEDINAALYQFERSFRNHYIDSFCLILRQMQDSGYAVKLLGDIRLQIEEMEAVQLKEKKEALEMQLQIFQLLLFVGILAMVMYGCVLALFQNIDIF